jgi:hypothetical protein
MPILLAWKTNFLFLMKRIGLPHGLPAPLIVSLTSYPARFHKLPLTLKCLLSQSVVPDRIILWIANDDKDALTPEILSLETRGLEIAYCDDLRSYKKIIPTLERYPNSFIVTADDDVYYWRSWLADLVNKHKEIGANNQVICYRAHQIRLTENGLPRSYVDWKAEIREQSSSALIFQTGIGGVLYPPGVFHPDVTKVERFKELCPYGDDIWLYWMVRLNGGTVRNIGDGRNMYCWRDTQETALFHSNLDGGGNDRQISAMVAKYGFPIE